MDTDASVMIPTSAPCPGFYDTRASELNDTEHGTGGYVDGMLDVLREVDQSSPETRTAISKWRKDVHLNMASASHYITMHDDGNFTIGYLYPRQIKLLHELVSNLHDDMGVETLDEFLKTHYEELQKKTGG